MVAAIPFSSGASDDEKVEKDIEVLAANTILEIAVQTEFLSTLVKAIQAGELAATLQGDGPYTIFAPTNEAFNKLPAGTLEELMRPANRGRLQGILNNHVVQGKIMSGELSNGQNAKSLGNNDLNVSKAGNQLKVNGAAVTTKDIEASNGVIHIVDTLILPRR